MNNLYVKSPLNYTGGKHKLLPQIVPLFPEKADCFIDLFCGGANVAINSKAKQIVYNDNNEYIIRMYELFDKMVYSDIEEQILDMISYYSLSDSNKHGYEYYGCNSSSGLGKYNKNGFMKLRDDFNKMDVRNDEYFLKLFVLIVYGFNNQIRFNRKGEYNLPVGKRDFNKNIRNNLHTFMDTLHSQEKVFMSCDFEQVNCDAFGNSIFVYCDPPYLITTASYNEMGGWTEKNEKELLSYLDSLDNKGVKFALSNVLTHKGRINEILQQWTKKYHTHFLNFNYNNSSYHGKNIDKLTQEILVTNY